MRLRLQGPACAGKESLGPFRKYLLTNGLELTFDRRGGAVGDGVGSVLAFPAKEQPNEQGLFSPKQYFRILEEVQTTLSVELLGFQDDPRGDVMFGIDDQFVSGSALAESLLGRLVVLESLITKRVSTHSKANDVVLINAREIVANLEDSISYGKIGPSDLDKEVASFRKRGIPIEEAFFMFNAMGIAEDMRNALLAACFHFRELNTKIRRLNETEVEEVPIPHGDDEPWEIRTCSQDVDELSHRYTSAVVASYTSLDLLYVLFVYLTRVPFLDATFPSMLHFPDTPDRSIFQNTGSALPTDPPATDLPYAIANLSHGQFGSLRKTRNALVHNMGTDSIRARVYKGRNLPPVNNHPLQYVQYLSSDLSADGTPVMHPWVRRFYEEQSNAQHSLLTWLETTWQCAFDTTEWLIHRWSHYVGTT